MTWKYEPTLAQNERYMFDGKSVMTRGINAEFSNSEIAELLAMVETEAERKNGIEYIQKLTHITKNKVVWIIQELSLEQKERMKQEEREWQIEEYDYQTILFPDEY